MIDGIVPEVWGFGKDGMGVEWVADVIEPLYVEAMPVVAGGTALLEEEVLSAVTGMVESSIVGEVMGVTLSLPPEVVGIVEVLFME